MWNFSFVFFPKPNEKYYFMRGEIGHMPGDIDPRSDWSKHLKSFSSNRGNLWWLFLISCSVVAYLGWQHYQKYKNSFHDFTFMVETCNRYQTPISLGQSGTWTCYISAMLDGSHYHQSSKWLPQHYYSKFKLATKTKHL